MSENKSYKPVISYVAISKYFKDGKKAVLSYLDGKEEFNWTKAMIPGHFLHKKYLLGKTLDTSAKMYDDRLGKDYYSMFTQDICVELMNRYYMDDNRIIGYISNVLLKNSYSFNRITKVTKLIDVLQYYIDKKYGVKPFINYICYLKFKTYIDRMSEAIESDKDVYNVIVGNYLKDPSEILYEYKHNFVHNGHKHTVRFDKIEIDTKSKQIVVIDLKSTGRDCSEFSASINAFNYDVQGSISEIAAKDYVMKANDLTEDEISEYTYKFIFAISSKKSNASLPSTIHRMTSTELDMGRMKVSEFYTMLEKEGIVVS